MGTDNMPDFSSIIVALREQRGWKSAELAKRAGLTPAAITYIEKGKKQPGFDTLSKIARAFGMDFIDLLTYQKNISQDKPNEKSDLVKWALQPENLPYLEFARRIAEKVPVEELKYLEVKKTVDINIDINKNKEGGK